MRRTIALLLAMAAAAGACLGAGRPDWGKVETGQDADGNVYASLENSRLRLRYGWRKFKLPEGVIVEFINKAAPSENNADDRIDAAAWRGTLKSATVLRDDASVKTVRLEWNPLKGNPPVEEVSIYKDSPYVRIDYLHWFVNIVDIGSPGGARPGVYEILGAKQWKRGYVGYPKVYFDRAPSDIGHENITQIDQPGPLQYKGWFIMGICHRTNGRGYGRVVSVDSVDIVKLLFERGFELFPYYRRTKQRFTSYLYLITHGPREAMSLGRKIAREAGRGPRSPMREDD